MEQPNVEHTPHEAQSQGEKQPTQPGATSPIKASILIRVKFLYLILGLICLFILAKIIWIQAGSSGDELRDQGIQYSFRTEKIEPCRGNILAADGRILTTTMPLYELRFDMAAHGLSDEVFLGQYRILCDSLSALFKDRPAAHYAADLGKAYQEKKRYYKFAPRKVNYVELQRISRFPILSLGQNRGGFIAEQSNRRIRPLGNVASRTVGFVNSNGVKVGLEGGLDSVLCGVNGMVVKQKISGDFWIPISSDQNVDPIPGLDVQTTIDIELQDIVQTALRERLQEVEADWGTVVIMEVATGHIKAIANATRKSDGQVNEEYNYAVGMSLEPGSTFKLASLLALVDDAKMPMSEEVNTDGGDVMIGRARVRDSHSGGYGTISMERAFEVSSNVGFAKAVNRHYSSQPERFVNQLKKMGVGESLGLEITGEGRSVIKDPSMRGKGGWDGTTLTMMSYGYALHITPLQTLTLYNAVANGGKMVRPQLVSALLDKGKIVKSYPTTVMHEQIASPASIRIAQQAMRGVVQRGTAKSLENPLYTVAAKTGTAQVAMGRSGYQTADGSRHYLGSIAGYFPAENPRYSMIIAIKTFYRAGSGKLYYGGQLASQLFRTIGDRIYGSSFQFLRPSRSSGSVDLTARSRYGATRTIGARGGVVRDSLSTPIVTGLTLREALHLLESEGYQVKYSGRGMVAGYVLDTDSLSGKRTVTLTMK